MDKVKDKLDASPNCGRKPDHAIGLCVNCGHRVTLCGKPFTADVECANCRVINHFRNSQQPVLEGDMNFYVPV